MRLLLANEKGEVYEHPVLQAAGRTGDSIVPLSEEELIPLPPGATLVLVPQGRPLGFDRRGKLQEVVRDPYRGWGKVYAVAALLPQGFTRLYLPAYARREAQPLPLFGFTAVAWREDGFYVAARRTDDPERWDPCYYSTPQLPRLIERRRQEMPGNRLLKHLARCALEYNCFTAQNIFYRRWEGGIPSSPVCNAGCLGCISFQPAECCPAPQSRIDFLPTWEEIVEVGWKHLSEGEEAIISFGQGCEGEPALQAPLLATAIKEIRKRTSAGTININTNGGHTAGIAALVDAGLDTMRVSFISAREEVFRAYFCPRNYSLQDVKASIREARKAGVYVSLNLLTMPGLTDRPKEIRALVEFIRATGVNMVQLRNLNIDPDYLFSRLPRAQERGIGVGAMVDLLRRELPEVEIGNFSRPRGREKKN